jgi:hypothetical protein
MLGKPTKGSASYQSSRYLAQPVKHCRTISERTTVRRLLEGLFKILMGRYLVGYFDSQNQTSQVWFWFSKKLLNSVKSRTRFGYHQNRAASLHKNHEPCVYKSTQVHISGYRYEP